MKILILAANPSNTDRLRLDREVRDIEEGLIRAQQRDCFEVIQRWAVSFRDLQRAILELNPQIVHFSGHRTGEDGLVLEDGQGQAQLVSTAALAGLFELFADQVQCVLLNACYSEVQGRGIAQHISYVIGMNQAIGDIAAREFAVGFYDALGAGRDLEFAFYYARNSIQMAGIAEHLTPVLLRHLSAEQAHQINDQPTLIDLFHSHRRRAYARQNAPTWAERSFWEHCGRHPQPSWYRGSLFGPNPTHQQMLDYYSYLQKSANRLSKNQDWICQEFEKECGAGSWKQLINLRRKILGDTHPDAPPACLI